MLNREHFEPGLISCWRADTRPLHKVFDDYAERRRTRRPHSLDEIWLDLAMCERDPVPAERALASRWEMDFTGTSSFSQPTFLEGCWRALFGDDAAAQKAFTAARSEFDRTVREQPDYGPPLCMLGLIDAGSGAKRGSHPRGASCRSR